MRIRSLIIFEITVALIVAGSAYAQDPAVVNSKTIKVRFENDRVRVLEANLPPGVKEAVHSHPAYVIYVLEGGRYRNYASDGKVTQGELKTGEVLFREPLTHAAENIGEAHSVYYNRTKSMDPVENPARDQPRNDRP